jgi:hypothetical protein
VERIATIVHEVGHLVDYFGLPGEGFASESLEELSDWRDTILATDSVRKLLNGRREEQDRKMVEYLLGARELFARSYTQYIALRGQDSDMKHWLRVVIEATPGDDLPTQWTHEDFVPVTQALDILFRRQAWRQ